MSNFKFLLVVSLIISIGCSNDDPSEGSIQLTISSVNPTSAKQIFSSKTNNTNVIFTDFQISIRDVVFKNEDDLSSSLDTDEIQFRGPYQIDLLNNSNALSQTIGDVFVPDGKYKELRFKFHKDEDLSSNHVLFDKSIYIEGTIDGTPFEFWHDTSENLDVGRSTGIEVTNGTVNFEVQFDISQFLNSLHSIDLDTAVDGNGNGIIEINPNDNDGNQELARLLKENIKETADLINF